MSPPPIHRAAFPVTVPKFVDHHQRSKPLDISSALDVEQIDTDCFRSRSLYLPYAARGVFGGQVISQSLVAATKSVTSEFALHSLHSYFLLSVSPDIPVLYHVDRVRDGSSYATRFVRAVQDGKAVYLMMCSFQLSEHLQPSCYWPMPKVAPPEDCIDDVELKRRLVVEQPDRTEEFKAWILGFAQEQESSLVAIKHAGEIVDSDGRRTFFYWMKAKTSQKHAAPFQKCILAYISDIHLLEIVITGAGLKRTHSHEEPNAVGIASSLDHSLVYYRHDIDCSEWLLYAMTSPVSGHGRGYGVGLLYARDGTLLAAVNQEGVVRAKIFPPSNTTVGKARM